MKPVRLATLVVSVSIFSAGSPIAGSAQARPGTVANSAQPDGWEVSFAPRVGFFLPQGAAGSQSAVRRPTYGMELAVKRKDSWYGARALFERSTGWNPRQDLTTELLGNPSSPRSSSESEYFETVVVDAVFYTPVHQGVRGYMFTGYGSKIVGSPDDGIPILPYSLVGAARERAWHGGFGIEAPLGGGSALFEVGDYYGRNGGDVRVHDFHVTLMARISGVPEFIKTLVTGDESDG